MFILKQEITNLTDGVASENIYVRDGKAFVKDDNNEFMYDGTWYVRVGDKWVDLQGGIPSLNNVEFVDSPIFEMLFERKETSKNN